MVLVIVSCLKNSIDRKLILADLFAIIFFDDQTFNNQLFSYRTRNFEKFVADGYFV